MKGFPQESTANGRNFKHFPRNCYLHLYVVGCIRIKPFFLPNDISSTPRVLPDSLSERDSNAVVRQ